MAGREAERPSLAWRRTAAPVWASHERSKPVPPAVTSRCFPVPSSVVTASPSTSSSTAMDVVSAYSLAALHTFTSWSRPPLKSVRPSAEKASAVGRPTCERRTPTQLWDFSCHTRIVLSDAAESSCSRAASGWKATRWAGPSWPRKTCVQCPIAKSNTIAVASAEADATSVPELSKVKSATGSLCPFHTRAQAHVCASKSRDQLRNWRLSPAVASRLPSGCRANAVYSSAWPGTVMASCPPSARSTLKSAPQAHTTNWPSREATILPPVYKRLWRSTSTNDVSMRPRSQAVGVGGSARRGSAEPMRVDGAARAMQTTWNKLRGDLVWQMSESGCMRVLASTVRPLRALSSSCRLALAQRRHSRPRAQQALRRGGRASLATSPALSPVLVFNMRLCYFFLPCKSAGNLVHVIVQQQVCTPWAVGGTARVKTSQLTEGEVVFPISEWLFLNLTFLSLLYRCMSHPPNHQNTPSSVLAVLL